METKWIVQSNLFKEECVDEMIGILQRLNIPYELVKLIPFADGLPEVEKYEGPIVAVGTTSLIRNIDKYKTWFPGVWYNRHTFKPSVWGPKFGDLYLNHDFKIVKLKDVLKLFKDEYDTLFVRPDSDLKLFTGASFYKYEFEKWFDDICLNIESGTYRILKLDTDVSVSSDKHIFAEWRFVIADKEVVTGSRYYYDGHKSESSNPADFHQQVIDIAKQVAENDYQLSSSYVVDICLTQKNEYKIIELNCVNGSGWYKCDVSKIIQFLSNLAEKEYYNRLEQIQKGNISGKETDPSNS
jgi:hypothetical protein